MDIWDMFYILNPSVHIELSFHWIINVTWTFSVKKKPHEHEVGSLSVS